jgi:hypothetical protein
MREFRFRTLGLVVLLAVASCVMPALAQDPGELRQADPSPQCNHHNYNTGVVIAMRLSNTEEDAKRAALDAAKTKAKGEHTNPPEGLASDQAKQCPANCGPGNYDGDNNPKGNKDTQDAIPDDTATPTVQVGFAEAHWLADRSCPPPAHQAVAPALPSLALQDATKEVIYHKDVEPACGGSVLYAGGVIGDALRPQQGKAITEAKKLALTTANDRVRDYRRKQCPKKCQPSTVVGQPLADNAAKPVLHKQITQARHHPYIAYAFATWQVKVTCPKGPS